MHLINAPSRVSPRNLWALVHASVGLHVVEGGSTINKMDWFASPLGKARCGSRGTPPRLDRGTAWEGARMRHRAGTRARMEVSTGSRPEEGAGAHPDAGAEARLGTRPGGRKAQPRAGVQARKEAGQRHDRRRAQGHRRRGGVAAQMRGGRRGMVRAVAGRRSAREATGAGERAGAGQPEAGWMNCRCRAAGSEA